MKFDQTRASYLARLPEFGSFFLIKLTKRGKKTNIGLIYVRKNLRPNKSYHILQKILSSLSLNYRKDSTPPACF